MSKEPCQICEPKTERSAEMQKKLNNRCNRIEGQIRGIKGMIEKDAYCDDILNQIAAARSALDGLSRTLLEHHMHSCLIHKIEKGEYEVVDELLETIKKLIK